MCGLEENQEHRDASTMLGPDPRFLLAFNAPAEPTF